MTLHIRPHLRLSTGESVKRGLDVTRDKRLKKTVKVNFSMRLSKVPAPLDRALVPGARRGAGARGGGAGRAARRALLHAGALVAGAPPAHDPRGAAPGRRRRVSTGRRGSAAACDIYKGHVREPARPFCRSRCAAWSCLPSEPLFHMLRLQINMHFLCLEKSIKEPVERGPSEPRPGD